jgi:hypothetical protein
VSIVYLDWHREEGNSVIDSVNDRRMKRRPSPYSVRVVPCTCSSTSPARGFGQHVVLRVHTCSFYKHIYRPEARTRAVYVSATFRGA